MNPIYLRDIREPWFSTAQRRASYISPHLSDNLDGRSNLDVESSLEFPDPRLHLLNAGNNTETFVLKYTPGTIEQIGQAATP